MNRRLFFIAAATFAAMPVTAAAFPIAVKSMERHGSKVAMRQLADNSALLIAILAPCVTGIFTLRVEIVHLLIAPAFQAVALAILPLSVLAGSIRNLRAHFVDQANHPVQALERRLGLFRPDGDAGKPRDASDLVVGKRHCDRRARRQAVRQMAVSPL